MKVRGKFSIASRVWSLALVLIAAYSSRNKRRCKDSHLDGFRYLYRASLPYIYPYIGAKTRRSVWLEVVLSSAENHEKKIGRRWESSTPPSPSPPPSWDTRLRGRTEHRSLFMAARLTLPIYVPQTVGRFGMDWMVLNRFLRFIQAFLTSTCVCCFRPRFYVH